MSLDDRLAQWVQAGLLDAGQAERISAYERGRERPGFARAIAALGGMAIATGLVSIVASNWDEIPAFVKLGLDLGLVGGLGYGIVRWEIKGPAAAFETAIIVFYGLMLASIALIGQTYQLGGEARDALTAWTVLTVLVMSRSRSAAAAILWLAGLHTTYAFWLVSIGDQMPDMGGFLVGAALWMPLALALCGTSRGLAHRRPRLARVSNVVAGVELLGAATLGTFAFYGHASADEWQGLPIAFAVSTLLALWLGLRLPAGTSRTATRALLGTCVFLTYVPVLVSPGDAGVVAALAFIGLWLAVAYWAHRVEAIGLLNLATAFIGLRIIVVYFELFGSLLDTGLGLITGGLLTLGIVYAWNRKRRDFSQRHPSEHS